MPTELQNGARHEAPPLDAVERDGSSGLDDVLEATVDDALPAPEARVEGVVIGRLDEVSDGAVVTFDWCRREWRERARITGTLGAADVGRAVALVFESGDPRRPIVVGPIDAASEPRLDRATSSAAGTSGRRVRIEADEELVLACGDSSLTLTRAGKVLLKGRYVSNRSTGVMRLKGASVQIN